MTCNPSTTVRYWRNIGLGIPTPKEAKEGAPPGQRKVIACCLMAGVV